MTETLTDFSTPALARAIKANWADYYTYLGRAPRAELSVGPYLSWLLTGVPDSFLNVVFRTRLPAYGGGEVIDEALAHFRARSAWRVGWWAETETPRADLAQHLVARGLTFEEGGMGMAADLSRLPDDAPAPPGLAVQPVEDQALLQQWAHVAAAGFGLPAGAGGSLFDLLAGLGLELPIRSYLALLNGRPVGTSQLFLSAGVAGIYNVTCLPEARRQGVGAAVTLAPLLEARRRGYRASILQASSLGQGVYRRLGFQDYGRQNLYMWHNDSQVPAVE